MTIWQPELSATTGPRYRAIAQALASDIAAGRLKPGDRLPPQRNLAWSLGVTVGTVSRAYSEAERMGLVRGEVGRGTYVKTSSDGPDEDAEPGKDPGQVDMSIAKPPAVGEAFDLAAALEALARSSTCAQLADYSPNAGHAAHRACGARWLAKSGLEVEPARVVVTAGAQQGLLAALAAVTRPGDRLLTEALTFPGIQPAARMLGLGLTGLPMDQEGLLPDALEQAARAGAGRVLYCIPNLQNPTTAVMSAARRRAIAAVVERHGLILIEDDVFGLLIDPPGPPITSLVPDRGYLVTSVSKTLSPGLRVGYVAAPESGVERVVAAVRASSGMNASLNAEIVRRWIEGGAAERILKARRAEAAARIELARKLLDGHRFRLPAGSLVAWIAVPEPWRAAELASAARRRGLSLLPADVFAVDRGQIPHFVRVGLGGAGSREELERSLRLLVELMAAPPVSASGMI